MGLSPLKIDFFRFIFSLSLENLDEAWACVQKLGDKELIYLCFERISAEVGKPDLVPFIKKLDRDAFQCLLYRETITEEQKLTLILNWIDGNEMQRLPLLETLLTFLVSKGLSDEFMAQLFKTNSERDKYGR